MSRRDSLFGERIVWEGRPTRVRATRWQRAIAAGLFVTSLISVCFAVAIAVGLGMAPTDPSMRLDSHARTRAFDRPAALVFEGAVPDNRTPCGVATRALATHDRTPRHQFRPNLLGR